MIPVKIVSKVDIPIIQEDVLTKLITAELQKSNPEIEVTGIVFERKLDPQRIQAVVEAQVRGSNKEEAPTASEAVSNEKTSDAEDQTDILDELAEDLDKEENPKPKRKKVFE